VRARTGCGTVSSTTPCCAAPSSPRSGASASSRSSSRPSGTCAFDAGGFGRADLIPKAFPYLWRWRDLLRANPGLRLAWETDWPYFDPSPLRHLYGFVTRRDIRADGSICHPQPQIANDTISMARALRAMTLDAAYALGTDGAVGSLQPGKLADLVVLSADPRSVPPDDIPAIQVLATVVGGVTRFCAPPAATVCP